MEIDFGNLASKDRYRLPVGFIVPRPIAFVSTLGRPVPPAPPREGDG